jgi:uncharacterized membrane protein (UPF0136 family)
VTQIILACLAVGGVVAFARRRGVPALPAGLAAAAAWVPIGVLMASGSLTPGERQLAVAVAAAWIVLVAAGIWFVSGAPRPVPTWPWACPECRYANSRDVLECESCGARWKPDPSIKDGEAV